MQFLDTFLDRITMYRLVLYGLIGLLVLAIIFSFFDLVPYTPGAILFSTAFILFLSLMSNGIFSSIFEAPTNVESVYITALILALIVAPYRDPSSLPILFWAPILATASKYILAINKRHIFNPAAIAIVLTALWLDSPANWWVGTVWMAPFVAIFGFLIVRKLRRWGLIAGFVIAAVETEIVFTVWHGGNVVSTMQGMLLHSSFLFFTSVMLTEPFTMPPTQGLRVFYGVLVGFLFSPHIHLGSLYSTPELALVVGNVFSYLVSPKEKLFLHIQEKKQYGDDTVDYIFEPTTTRMTFAPGQYMEWTLPHDGPDTRGNRRYFTIASSPTEDNMHVGVKFYPQGSSFKRAMARMDKTVPIVAGSLSGDFTLPDDPKVKLAFLAGGIGITPFRSMIKYCIDTHQERDIVLIYANKHVSEIAYADVLDEAKKIGVKTVLTLTDEHAAPKDWHGKTGRVTADMIRDEIPDYKYRLFYLSGPHAMVVGYEAVLRQLGVSSGKIKKDFFPGYV